MDNIEAEIWKSIPGYEGVYEASSLGIIRSIARPGAKGKELTRCLNRTGYYRVTLCAKGIKAHFELHRLIGRAFIPNPENKPCLNHMNGIKTDNRVCNLEWCTRSENMQHAFRIGLVKVKGRKQVNRTGALNPYAKPIMQFDLSGNKIREFETAVQAEQITGISRWNIGHASRGEGRTSGGYIWKPIGKAVQ